jgi:hypothetical protein
MCSSQSVLFPDKKANYDSACNGANKVVPVSVISHHALNSQVSGRIIDFDALVANGESL